MKLIIPFLTALVIAVSATAAEVPSPVGRGNLPIHITSTELHSDSKKKIATFVGNVVAKQGDVTILTDRMVVYYSSAGDDLDRVECIGNVRVMQGNRTGVAGRAVYESSTGKITLTEKPKVHQGDDVVTGSVITYYVGDEKSVVQSGPGSRVEAVIHPKRKQKDEQSQNP